MPVLLMRHALIFIGQSFSISHASVGLALPMIGFLFSIMAAGPAGFLQPTRYLYFGWPEPIRRADRRGQIWQAVARSTASRITFADAFAFATPDFALAITSH